MFSNKLLDGFNSQGWSLLFRLIWLLGTLWLHCLACGRFGLLGLVKLVDKLAGVCWFSYLDLQNPLGGL